MGDVPTREDLALMREHQVLSDKDQAKVFGEWCETLLGEVERLRRSEKACLAITDACARWGWEYCTTEVELIAQIDAELADNTRLRDREARWQQLDDALTNGDDSTVYDLRTELYPHPEGDPFPPAEPTDE